MTTEGTNGPGDGAAMAPDRRLEAPSGAAGRALPRVAWAALVGVIAATVLLMFAVSLIGPPGEAGRDEALRDPLGSMAAVLDTAAELHDSGDAFRAAQAEAREAGRLDAFEEQLADVRTRVEQARTGMASHRMDVEQELSSRQTWLATVEETVQTLAETLRSLDTRLGETEQRIAALSADIASTKAARPQRPVARRPRARAVPPFTVDVIDRWDGVAYAVVSQDGATAFLREGAVRAGWRLASIDANARTVRLLGPREQVVTVHLAAH